MMNKKAVVTGGSNGIGLGIVRCLAESGYDIALSYHSHREGAEAIQSEVREHYGRECHIMQANYVEDGAGKRFFAQAVTALGNIDLLVNNAGITRFESIFDLTEETMDTVLKVDFRNYMILMREACLFMRKKGVCGSIVNITSTRGERAYPKDAVYGGVKAALNRALQSVALDAAPYGIRVNGVAPGATRVNSKAEIEAKGQPDYLEELSKEIPLRRPGMPEDIGQAVVWLASDKASYVTGVTLRVDGGLILPGPPEAPH